MKTEQAGATEASIVVEPKQSPISKGLLMAPKTAGYLATINKHKRAGSTGTTGDESYTTDEEDNVEPDETDHGPPKMFTALHVHGDFGSYADIATITDKVGHLGVIHRNSSDSSVYSDLGLDKCGEDFENLSFSNASKDGEGDCGVWGRSVVEENREQFTRLQNELKEAHQVLKLRDEEVGRLSRIRQDVEAELEELTASLFQVRIFVVNKHLSGKFVKFNTDYLLLDLSLDMNHYCE